jgi:hypothetical protein
VAIATGIQMKIPTKITELTGGLSSSHSPSLIEKEIRTDKAISAKSLKKAKIRLLVRLIDNSAETRVLKLSNAATSHKVHLALSQYVVEYIANPARAAYLFAIFSVCKVEKRATTLFALTGYAVQGSKLGCEYP